LQGRPQVSTPLRLPDRRAPSWLGAARVEDQARGNRL